MSREFEYKPKFRDIRVRPPKEGEKEQENDVNHLKPGEKKCDWPGCIVAGGLRASAVGAKYGMAMVETKSPAIEHPRTCTCEAGRQRRMGRVV